MTHRLSNDTCYLTSIILWRDSIRDNGVNPVKRSIQVKRSSCQHLEKPIVDMESVESRQGRSNFGDPGGLETFINSSCGSFN